MAFEFDAASAKPEGFDPATATPEKPAGAPRKAADVGLAFAQGAVGGAKALTDVAGADNPVSATLGRAGEAIGGALSPQRKAELAARQTKIKDAEASGSTLQEVGAHLGGFAEAPASAVAQGLGSIVPTVAAALIPGGQGAAAARAGAMLGVGAAQGAGAVKGSIYDRVRDEQVAAGVPAVDAEVRASEAQAYSGPNVDQIALGAGLGAVAGRVGAEGAIAGAAAGQAPRGALRRIAHGAAEEGVTEAAQGGQEQLAGNVALDRAGITTDPMQGVVGQAAVQGLVGGVIGGGVGLAAGDGAPNAQPAPVAPPAATRPVTPAQTPSQGGLIPVKQTGANAIPPAPGFDPTTAVPEPSGPVQDVEIKRFTPRPERPSTRAQEMGINPDAGPVSAAATTAVNSGADVAIKDAQRLQQEAEDAAKVKKSPTAKEKAPPPPPPPAGPVIGPLSAALNPTPAPPGGTDVAAPTQAEQGAPGQPAAPATDPGPAPAPAVASVEVAAGAVPEPVDAGSPAAALNGGRDASQEAGPGQGQEATPAAEVAPGASPGAGQPAASADVPAGAEVSVQPAETVEAAAHVGAATSPFNDLPEPTEAQKKAGNYRKGRVRIAGLDVSIENPEGSTRSGTDRDGKSWENTLQHHYGYIRRTTGGDDEQIDVFIKPDTPVDYAGKVFVVDQVHPDTGKFDEHKVMMGFENALQARVAYKANYAKGWKGLQAITPMTMEEFKAWVKAGPQKGPVAAAPQSSLQQPSQAAAAPAQPAPQNGADALLPRQPDVPKSPASRGEVEAPSTDATPAPDALATPRAQVTAREAAKAANIARLKAAREKRTAPPRATGLSVGIMPNTAEPVTVKDGVVHIGAHEALDFDTGEPIRAADGATDADLRAALEKGGALSAKQRFFGGESKPAKTETDLQKAETNTPPPETPTPELAPDRKQAAQPATDHTIVGRRADGTMIRKDSRGVRFYAEGGVRIFETVTMRPTRDGMQVERGPLKPDFMTAEEAAAAAPKPVQPTANAIFTEEAAAAARAILKRKLGTLNSGIDPEMLQAGVTLAGYHIEKGARTFAAYARAMLADLGEGARPYLKSWYMGVKYDPRAAGFQMDDAAAVDALDVATLGQDAPIKAPAQPGKRKPAAIVDNRATNPGEFLVRDAGSNLARFEIGQSGRPIRVKHFYESEGTRDFAMESIEVFLAERSKVAVQPATAVPQTESTSAAPAPASALADAKTRWNAANPEERARALLAAGWFRGSPNFQAMLRTSWDDMRDSQQARLSKAMQSAPAPEPAQPPSLPQPPEQALKHAKDLGGRVVWHSGDLALIEGYSLLTGDSVYAAAKGPQRTRVDIASYTGAGFTGQERRDLLEAKRRAVAAAQAEMAANPDGPFSDGALVFGADIPARVRDVVRGWIPLLGLQDARIVVTTPASGAAMADTLAGRFRRIGKASLSGDNTNGTMQPLGESDFHIAVRPTASTLKTLEVLAHELGHIAERKAFAQAAPDVQAAIRQVHTQWLSRTGKGTALDMARSMRALRSGRTTGFLSDTPAAEASAYWKSFGEWFADQVSRWATTQDKPLGVVDQFFKRLADRLRTFFTGERAQFLPDATVATWLNSLSKDVPPVSEPVLIEPAPQSADTAAEDTPDATRPLDRPSPGALAGAPAPDVRPPAEGGQAGASPDRGGNSDGRGDARPDDAGQQPAGGVGAGPRVVPVPARGAAADAPDAPKPRVSRAPRTGARPVEPGDAGRGLSDNPAPNAPQIAPPQVKAEDFTIAEDLELGEGGQKTKYRNNVAAIRLVQELEASGRMATPEEQRVLALYVGWGGLSQVFDANHKDWTKEHAEITALLSPEDLASAAQSTRYAHYTSRPVVVDGIYAAMRHFGFSGGKTLEAGAGVGNFLGLMPVDMRSAGRFTAIEREPIAAAITKHLYPRQIVQRADFTEFKGNDAYFDAAIGNPPFAADPQVDRSGRKHLSGLSLHNYFFAKSVDMLREGGILAQVVTNSFLDAKTDNARRYISDRTRLLGAIRLPNNAFSKNAGTEVTTDIIFLQKRPDAEIGGKAARADAKRWMEQGIYRDARGRTVALNQYFIDNPDMMLGDFGAYGTMYGPEQPALVARPGQDTLAALRDAVARLPGNVYRSVAETGSAAHTDAAIRALTDPQVKEGGYFLEDGKLMQRLPDLGGEARGVEITPATQWTEKTKLGEQGFERIKALAELRSTTRGLIAAEIADNAADMDRLRAELNRQYDAYRLAHGLINDPGTLRVFDDDPDYPLLASLEHGYTPAIGIPAAKRMGIKPVPSSAKKGPIFTQRVVAARQQVQKVSSAADALDVSMAERGKLDAAYIGELLGKDAEAVLRELTAGDKPLLFRDPATDEYVLRDAYLSGNVRAKLAQARSSGMYVNERELEAVQPEDVGAHEIAARLGSPWVPTSVYADFARELFGKDAKASVGYLKANSSYQLSLHGGNAVALTNTWGTPDYPGDTMLSALMNNRTIKVTYRDSEGKTHTDADATENANVKAQELRDRFRDWLFTDPERSEVLVKAYNETNNNYVTRVYDGSHMTFPGKVPDAVIKFRRHQRNAIARIVQDRTALLDHVVGAGKTFTVIAAAMEMRRTGTARKPMVAVPNHLVKQWAADFYRLYPGANILTATKKDFEKVNRRKFLAKIATGDWDAVVIAHSSFGFIRPAPEFEARFNEGQIRDIMATIKAVQDGEGDKPAKKRTIKQLEGMKERLQNRIRALRDKPMDDLLDFEQLGVDQLFVDEAHMFKNLMYTTKMQGVSGMQDPAGSQRAYDMYVKTQEIYERNGRGQGVVFATGTPISNSLAEMYHMMRYLMPAQMKELGFESFDAWANTFASVDQVWMQAASGDGFKASNRMSNFENTHELLKMFDQVADTVTMDDIQKAYSEENSGAEFPLPKVKTGRRIPVSLEKSPEQNAYMQDIARRAKILEQRKGPPKKGDDNILVIMGDARKAAMDIRLVDPEIQTRSPGGRIDRATDEAVARYRQYDKWKGTQVVFSDLGTPIKHARAELKEYEDLQARIAKATDDVVADAAFGREEAMTVMEDVEAAQAELEAKGQDWLSAVKAALRGFSVYDDFKAALIEKGIPEAEIAFIHDFNTDDQKAALFRKVNAGQVRFLMGSTAKLGAGTNIQERLVAEHHLDVPWRPSDVEQREGRIIRQGNKLMDEVPGFEIEILAYVTRDTLDMRMWQVQEAKLKMINQLRARKIGREVENAFEDMEMSAGEMQAAATGDINLLREIQIRNDVKKLEQRRRSFEAQRNDLISRRRRAAERVQRLPAELAEAQRAAENALAYQRDLRENPEPFRMTIDGKEYENFDEARVYLDEMTSKREQAYNKEGFALVEDGKAVTRAAPIAININGEVVKNRNIVAEMLSEARGDAEPIRWTVNGQMHRRRARLATSLRQNIVDSIADEVVKPLGTFAGYDVAAEGMVTSDGAYQIDVTLSRDGKVELSNTTRGTAIERAPSQVIGVVEHLVAGAASRARYLARDLQEARKDLAELERAADNAEWPDQPKLEAARAAHRAVLDLLKKKEQPKPPAEALARGGVGGPMSVSAVRAIADPVAERLGVRVVVVAFPADLPIQAPSDARGLYMNGTVYVVAGNARSREDVLKAIGHEAIAHHGLRSMLGREGWFRLMNQIQVSRKMGNKPLQEISDYVRRTYVDENGKFNLSEAQEADEIAARAVEQAVDPVTGEFRPGFGWLKAIFQRVAEWLRSKGITVPFTNLELQGALVNAMRHLQQGQRQPAGDALAAARAAPADADIALARGLSAKSLSEVTSVLKDATRSIGTVSWWQKTVGTQFHKSTKDQDFKRVFDAYVQQTDDTAHYAIEAERNAPDILMRMESLGDAFRSFWHSGTKHEVDLKAVSRALFANIEGQEGIQQVRFNDDSLRIAFGLTPKQIEMYHQARAAVDTSIERLAQTYVAQVGAEQGLDIEAAKNMDLDDTSAMVKTWIQQRHDEARAASRMAADIKAEGDTVKVPKAPTPADTAALLARIDGIVAHAEFLQENGYMPALRFGEFAVTVTDPDGETLHFEMFESKLAANLAAARLARENPGAKVERSVMNPEQYAMFKGVSPETVELFAKFTGADQNEAYQQYIALAKSARSVRQRQLKRKGTAGFSEDATRVMASFITSNARQAAVNMNIGEINDAMASKSLARKGDVQREAQKLHEYMGNPIEEARRLRSFMFLHFMGGSVASALVNMTQPVLQTAPYLHQFAGAKTARIMAAAAKMAATGQIEDADLSTAARRAADDGITEPHEIHQLMADASGSAMGGNLKWRAAMKVWGSMFAMAESFNRRITFLAAYQVARETGRKDAYEFARRAVIETQGLYSKANRPNWARGAVGATLFTFKQFSIAYLEWFSRLPAKQKVMALTILVLAAGLQGLPFADDLEDLIDTIGQSMGYNTNSKKALRKLLVDNLGEDLGEILNSGIFSAGGADLSGRLGMGNLLPGTAIFKPSETDKSRTLGEVAGALGGVLQQFQRALGKVQDGDVAGAAREVAPTAVRNLLQGIDMASTGTYKDTRGYKVADVTAMDSFLKMLGLQPEHIARASRAFSDELQDKNMAVAMEKLIADRWAAGIAEKDPEAVAAARRTLVSWNENNPQTPIAIKPAQIVRRVREMEKTRNERFLKTVPREMRPAVAAELR